MSGAERRDHEYDVCLSFAGEQRDYVQAVAEALQDHGIRVFYDAYEKANLWGKDLYAHLDEVYQNRARYCVAFLSADYADKMWTSHERSSAFARALTDSSEYLLPARFDDTVIAGFRPNIGYIDLRETTPAELVELIIEKVSPTQAEPEPTSEPVGWEYELLGATMLRGKQRLAPRHREHTARVAKRNDVVLDAAGSARFLRDAYARIGGIIGGVETVFSAENQSRALGGPHTPGDRGRVIAMGNGLIGVYDALLTWAARVRGATVPTRMSGSHELLARVADLPLSTLATFVEDYVVRAGQLAAAGTGPTTTATRLKIELELATDDRATSQFAHEFASATADAG
jgi:hypothetical protein